MRTRRSFLKALSAVIAAPAAIYIETTRLLAIPKPPPAMTATEVVESQKRMSENLRRRYAELTRTQNDWHEHWQEIVDGMERGDYTLGVDREKYKALRGVDPLIEAITRTATEWAQLNPDLSASIDREKYREAKKEALGEENA